MANELPEINPFNAVYQSEKYYDFDPKAFKEVGLPTLKTIGGGIADIILPQDEIEVAMHAVPPLLVYKRVKKIIDKANELRAEAQSFLRSARESGSRVEREAAKFRNNEADSMVKDIPEDDMKIYKDVKKSLTSDEVNKQGIARLRETLGIKK